jgi:hypothetical protein
MWKRLTRKENRRSARSLSLLPCGERRETGRVDPLQGSTFASGQPKYGKKREEFASTGRFGRIYSQFRQNSAA